MMSPSPILPEFCVKSGVKCAGGYASGDDTEGDTNAAFIFAGAVKATGVAEGAETTGGIAEACIADEAAAAGSLNSVSES
jgi:hypothetical protein